MIVLEPISEGDKVIITQECGMRYTDGTEDMYRVGETHTVLRVAPAIQLPYKGHFMNAPRTHGYILRDGSNIAVPREALRKVKCCSKMNVQSFGPGGHLKSETSVCMDCGRLH